MRRLVLLTSILLLSTALPASAKMPPFDVEVDSVGDTVLVEVTIKGDKSLIHDFSPSNLDGLLAVFPAGKVDAEGRPSSVHQGRIDVPLARVEPGTYQGSLTLEPGSWAVVPFPDITDVIQGSIEGWYPSTIVVEVKDERSAVWALAVLSAVMVIAWRHRSRLHI